MSRTWTRAYLPACVAALAAVALLVVALVRGDLWRPPASAVPPVEELSVERVLLDDEGIGLLVQAGPWLPVRIAQVQVDGAYWSFEQDPLGSLPPLASGWLHIPYPWVLGESHLVTILSRTGAIFEHWIVAARPTPAPTTSPATIVLGLALGLLPLGLGRLVRPVLPTGGDLARDFVFAVAVGLLASLLPDTLSAAFAAAALAQPDLRGEATVWLTAGLTLLLLLGIGRLGQGWSRPTAATALRLGAHNGSSGLAVGASLASGSTMFAALLAAAFVLHRTLLALGLEADRATGGAAPATSPGLWALAVLPAVAGVLAGGHAFAPRWAAVALAAGAGAILHVLCGTAVLLAHRAQRGDRTATALYGLAVGLSVMYASTLLVDP
jgi:hypothetical protein